MIIKPITDFSLLNGTGLVGYVTATRQELTALFGVPNVCSEVLGPSSDDKVTTEWAFTINGVACTLYDYKEERAPAMDEVFDWHVGSRLPEVINLLLALKLDAKEDF